MKSDNLLKIEIVHFTCRFGLLLNKVDLLLPAGPPQAAPFAGEVMQNCL